MIIYLIAITEGSWMIPENPFFEYKIGDTIEINRRLDYAFSIEEAIGNMGGATYDDFVEVEIEEIDHSFLRKYFYTIGGKFDPIYGKILSIKKYSKLKDIVKILK